MVCGEVQDRRHVVTARYFVVGLLPPEQKVEALRKTRVGSQARGIAARLASGVPLERVRMPRNDDRRESHLIASPTLAQRGCGRRRWF
jgi:hypothetical protein